MVSEAGVVAFILVPVSVGRDAKKTASAMTITAAAITHHIPARASLPAEDPYVEFPVVVVAINCSFRSFCCTLIGSKFSTKTNCNETAVHL
jgi:hypothetical protein